MSSAPLRVLADPHSGERSDDLIDAGLLAAGTVGNLLEVGGEGNDTLRGSPGNDTLSGGPGTDRFELRGGHDVTDAEPGEVVVP
jgi:Ca2+-binding RTX toxin-like protein